MRLVLDLQGAQATNRTRGIGRYSLAMALAMARNAGSHDIHIVLNQSFLDSIESLRANFETLVPQNHIHVWSGPRRIREVESGSEWRRRAAEQLREAFIANLDPDVVYVSSLFEGLVDDATTSIGTFSVGPPVGVTLYDLIPTIYRETYLNNTVVESWYERKLDHLRRARLWLAISESVRREGIDLLGLPGDWVVNTSAAADPHFRSITLSTTQIAALQRRYGLTRPFALYTGGIDHRKNVEGLIRAFALLPWDVRREYQLAIVCAIQEEERMRLEKLGLSKGLRTADLVLTGFVPENDLVALYNTCKVFVYPSWHEGFGLPPLEAMACGAPVIATNSSSLPEVLGRADALFPKGDDSAMARKLHEVLTNDTFREELRSHGVKQAKKFSWDRSARIAVEALEKIGTKSNAMVMCGTRPKLAFVSPLPPQRTGIANYSMELLPELSCHYNIDVVVDQAEVTSSWVTANCAIRSAEWFDRNAHRYDRILYHFGNSEYHGYMLELLERHPGVVVLHDFFLSGLAAYMETTGRSQGFWTKELYAESGFKAVRERLTTTDTAEVVLKYPCNAIVVRNALGVLVHSEHARELARRYYGRDRCQEWAVVPHLRAPARGVDRRAARAALGIADTDFVVCSFGHLGRTKLNHRVLAAWLASTLAQEDSCRLIFVGHSAQDEYGSTMQQATKRCRAADRVTITGFVDAKKFVAYLASADLAVQLRTASRGETSGTVLDCMNYGTPVIINAHGAMAELPRDCVYQLPDEFEDSDLVHALEKLRGSSELRGGMCERARTYLTKRHDPREIAKSYANTIERYYGGTPLIYSRVVEKIATIDSADSCEQDWLSVAKDVAANFIRMQSRQLLVDVSVLATDDTKTGVQRVTRAILNQLLENPPEGFRVEPIVASGTGSYRYARKFSLRLLGCDTSSLQDDPVEVNAGDYFLGLDLAPHLIPGSEEFLKKIRSAGGKLYFVVYDLLPVRHPEWFVPGARELYEAWLRMVAASDGALCDSKATAHDLVEWLEDTQPRRYIPLDIGWFHSGADIMSSVPTTGVSDEFREQLWRFGRMSSVLMVGTVEPRKGHEQALDAFELLWDQGVDACLVIVGKEGWMVQRLATRIRHHVEAGKRLFWLESLSDEALSALYEVVDGVLAASLGEGFGLPLVEAAQHGTSILARDIPVFQEVAAQFATYFSGETPGQLAAALKTWLEAIKSNAAVASTGMRWKTWEGATRDIVRLLENRNDAGWLEHWMPKEPVHLTEREESG